MHTLRALSLIITHTVMRYAQNKVKKEFVTTLVAFFKKLVKYNKKNPIMTKY